MLGRSTHGLSQRLPGCPLRSPSPNSTVGSLSAGPSLSARQRHAKYSGDQRVASGGDSGYTTTVLDQDHGHLEKGRRGVTAEITDMRDETNPGRAEVYVKKDDRH